MKRPLGTTIAIAITLAGPGSGRLAAQETPSDTLLTVQHYLDWEQVGDPQISPDGAQIVYARRWVNQQEDRWESALWLMNADGTDAETVARFWCATICTHVARNAAPML